jgi:hypothetical protein
MHGKQLAKRNWTENLIVLAMGLVALGMVVTTDRMGFPQKWHAAIVGTFVTFGGVGLCYPRQWSNLSFWLLMGICLAVHTVAIWIVFAVLLASVKTMGTLVWSPVAFAEGIALLGIVAKFGRR